MTALPKSPPGRMTVDEFFVWPGDRGKRKLQLVNGEPRAMTPASPTHRTIQATVARLIGLGLLAQGGACRVVTEPGVVPRVKADTNLRVPDIAVTCAPDEASHKSLPDPVLIIEILSPSNELETRENVWAFTTIPSVREILILHSTKIAAELRRRRPDGNWPEQPDEINRDEALALDGVGFQCQLLDVYAQTHLVRVAG
jgi:Uma2 family endonuclease